MEDPEDPVFPHSRYPEARYAKDYGVRVGTPVCAVLPGVVWLVVDTHSSHGFEEKFAKFANFVCLEHATGVYSEYIHLGFRSARVRKGDVVSVGDVIGVTGWSGLMNTPHLHLNLFRMRDQTPESVPFVVLETQ